MDFTKFIAEKEMIEPALKAGLYIVMQSHLPAQYQAFRMGLAGRPVDSATSSRLQDSNLAGRFGMYLNYWGPQNAKVFACLTVPRKAIMGFAERPACNQVWNDTLDDAWYRSIACPLRVLQRNTAAGSASSQGRRCGRSVHVCWQQHQPDHKADFEKRRCHRDSASATPQIRALG